MVCFSGHLHVAPVGSDYSWLMRWMRCSVFKHGPSVQRQSSYFRAFILIDVNCSENLRKWLKSFDWLKNWIESDFYIMRHENRVT